jgi:hypothetical protein
MLPPSLDGQTERDDRWGGGGEGGGVWEQLKMRGGSPTPPPPPPPPSSCLPGIDGQTWRADMWGRGIGTTESERGEAVKINSSHDEIILLTIYNKLFDYFFKKFKNSLCYKCLMYSVDIPF